MAAVPPNFGDIQDAFAAGLQGGEGGVAAPPEPNPPAPESPPPAPPAESGPPAGSLPAPGGSEGPAQESQPAEQPAETGSPETPPDDKAIDPSEFRLEGDGEGSKPEATPEGQAATEESQQEPGEPAPESQLTEEQEAALGKLEEIVEADPERVMAAMLQTNRGRRAYGSFQTLNEVARPENPEDGKPGGIGFLPTADQIKDYHRAHVAIEELKNFSPDAPERTDEWIGMMFRQSPETWTDPETKQVNHKQYPGTREVMERLPGKLMQENPLALNILANQIPHALAGDPEAFRTYASPFILLAQDKLLSMLSEVSGEEQPVKQSEKSRLLDAARFVKWAATGTWDEQLGPPNAGATAAGQPSGEVQQWRNRAEQAEQRERQATQQHQQATVQAGEGQIRQQLSEALSADVDKALKVITDRGKDPLVADSFRQKFTIELTSGMGGNPTQQRQLEDAIRNAARTGNLSVVPQLIKMQRQLYSAALYRERPKYLKAAGLAVLEQHSSERARLQHTASLTAPANGVQAPTDKTVGIAGPPEKQANESHDDFVQRMFRQKMTVTG